MPSPDGVTMNEPQIKALIAMYRAAISKIERDINSVTNFERARRAQLLRGIRTTLGNLQGDVDKWADEEIKQYYIDGLKEADKGLAAASAVTKTLAPFTVIDEKAVSALVADVKLGFAESIRGVGRSARRVVLEAEKIEIQKLLAQGLITGEVRQEIAAQVKEVLRTNGLAALIDKSGREWQLDTYSEMLVRTKAVEARNRGLGNRLAQYGHDLVQVSDHNSTHAACREWEGEILSYTGSNEKYPSFDDALAGGLFHPNCEHAINAIDPEIAEKTEAYDNPYNDIEPPRSEMDVFPGRDVPLPGDRTSTLRVPLNEAEKKFAKQKNVIFRQGQEDPLYNTFISKGAGGRFDPITNTVYVYTDKAGVPYHEFGHAVDNLFTGGGPLDKQAAKAALELDTDGIAIQRIMRQGFSEKEASDLLNGGVVGKLIDGKPDVVSLSPYDMRYFKQADEIFAEGYAQFRESPEKFKKYAPNLFKFFKDLL